MKKEQNVRTIASDIQKLKVYLHTKIPLLLPDELAGVLYEWAATVDVDVEGAPMVPLNEKDWYADHNHWPLRLRNKMLKNRLPEEIYIKNVTLGYTMPDEPTELAVPIPKALLDEIDDLVLFWKPHEKSRKYRVAALIVRGMDTIHYEGDD